MHTTYQKFWKLICGFALPLIFLFHPSPAYAQASDPPCNHGMRIVGEQSIYLSHMGLFNVACHKYQALFEVSFTGDNDPQKIYLDAQRQDPKQNEFTIRPNENFVLSELATGKRTSFKAEIFSGQFERSETTPKSLAKNVTVTIKKVHHFRRFQSGAKQPATAEFLLFGSNVEPLAAHLITAPPDYDQIVAINTPLTLTGIDLTQGTVRLVLPNRLTPTPSENLRSPLTTGVKPTVRVDGKLPNQAIEVGNQYFLETKDYR